VLTGSRRTDRSGEHNRPARQSPGRRASALYQTAPVRLSFVRRVHSEDHRRQAASRGRSRERTRRTNWVAAIPTARKEVE